MIPVDKNGLPAMALIPVDVTKRPLVQWKLYQTRLPTDKEVENWKKYYGTRIAGWAMPTGQVSGLVALDFDGEEGVRTYKKLGLRANVKTPGNGFHVWVEAPEYPVRTGAVDNRWPGMELKGDGGYVVVIGSNMVSHHAGSEETIGNYEVLDGRPTVLEDIDPDLGQFILQPKEGNVDFAVARVIAEALAKAEEGRNNAGFWLATQLRDLGIAKDQAWTFLKENFYDALPRGNHQYTIKELRDSWNSAYSSKQKTTESLLDVTASLDLWHHDYDGYVTLPTGENVPIRSRRLREYLSLQYYKTYNKSISRKAVDEGLDVLHALAQEAPEYEPKIRIAWDEDACYVNLDGNRYAIIDRAGWEIQETTKLPVKFLRTSGTLPVPAPKSNWNLLKKYINVLEEDWPLVQGVVLAAYMPEGSYPIATFTGTHGSGKSTTVSALVSLCDPRLNIERTRDTLPNDKRTLAVLAKNSCVLAFDNESHITKEISDALAMLSTGGEMRMRELYTDSSTTSFAAKRLVFINSIGDIVTESDLLDRSVLFECPSIDDSNKFVESIMWRNYEKDRPEILAAIFDSVKQGIRNLPNMPDETIGRLTDFYRWCTACGVPDFKEAYIRSLNRAPTIAVNNSFIGSLILNMLKTKPNPRQEQAIATAIALTGREDLAGYRWVGSFSMLHELGRNSDTGDWYKTTMGAINAYKRVKIDLRKLGVKIVEFDHLHQLWLAFKGAD